MLAPHAHGIYLRVINFEELAKTVLEQKNKLVMYETGEPKVGRAWPRANLYNTHVCSEKKGEREIRKLVRTPHRGKYLVTSD
jgi:hypothetical protein